MNPKLLGHILNLPVNTECPPPLSLLNLLHRNPLCKLLSPARDRVYVRTCLRESRQPGDNQPNLKKKQEISPWLRKKSIKLLKIDPEHNVEEEKPALERQVDARDKRPKFMATDRGEMARGPNPL